MPTSGRFGTVTEGIVSVWLGWIGRV
jgi:hypothetical protein